VAARGARAQQPAMPVVGFLNQEIGGDGFASRDWIPQRV